MEGEFEILRLLAELSLLFILITIPTFALSVSYLGRETTKSMKHMEKKRKAVEIKLKEKMRSLEEKKTGLEEIEREINEMKKEIEEYRVEEQMLKNQLTALSIKGAIYYPGISFGLAFLSSVLGIYYYTKAISPLEAEMIFERSLVSAIIFIFFGMVSLLRSLKAVQKAALGSIRKERDIYVIDWSVPTGALTGPRVIVVNDKAYHMGEPFDSWVREKGLRIKKGFGDNHVEYLSSMGIRCTCKLPPSIKWLEEQLEE